MDLEICVLDDKPVNLAPKVLQNGGELGDMNLETTVPEESGKSSQADQDAEIDVFRPRLTSAESSTSKTETPVATTNQSDSKLEIIDTARKGEMAEKAVQTDQIDYEEPRGSGSIVQCDHCKRRCFCNRNDPYDSNSSTQSMKLSADEKSKHRRRRWSPLIKKKQMMLNQPASISQSVINVCHDDRPHPQSAQAHSRPDNIHTHDYPCQSSNWMQPSSSSPKRWHIKYRQNRRRRRIFSEDKIQDHESLASSQCGSDPSVYSQKSLCTADDHRPSADHLRRSGLYNLCLQKTKTPLVKSSSCSPTVPFRRQTWSEKSRPSRPQYEGHKKNKGFLHMLRNLRGSCSETDISMEHRRSVDSEGYVDPFYITRNFNRLNLKRLSLSHPNLNCCLRGSTTPPSGLKGRVSAAVGRLERALTGKVSTCRTYSFDSQQSTSNGWNSDLPNSPTDSDAVVYSYNKDQHDPDAENGYMTFDPELNPPVRPRRILCSSCSSVPSSPGFQDACYDDVANINGCEAESIYESLDNYQPQRNDNAFKSLPSSDCETPPEVRRQMIRIIKAPKNQRNTYKNKLKSCECFYLITFAK